MISFYVYDIDSGFQVSGFFSTFKKAELECKKYSKKHGGIYSVSVAIQEIKYSNGILLEN